MSVAEFQGVMWDAEDFRTFETMCGFPNGSIAVARQIGNDAPKKCEIPVIGSTCMEAMLDIEYIKAVAGAVPLTDIYSAGYSLLNWAMQLGNMSDAPLINSVSYGNDERQQTSVQFMDSVNVQFQKLGAKGLSILFASGDQGVWGRSGPGKAFNPDFPAASPYVTAVGGTDFVTKGTIGDEKAWSDGGGGFSNTFAMPAYQASFVVNFKSTSTALPPQALWNSTGRGYPDVAALGGMGNPYCVVSAGGASGVAGTSASCPVTAAVFAKLNELRLASKKKPLGFLNPFICEPPVRLPVHTRHGTVSLLCCHCSLPPTACITYYTAIGILYLVEGSGLLTPFLHLLPRLQTKTRAPSMTSLRVPTVALPSAPPRRASQPSRAGIRPRASALPTTRPSPRLSEH